MLARELDEDRGATSFHLRQLGTYGFIAVDDERSEGRRKFWRIIPQDLRLPRVRGAAGAAEAGAAVSQMWRDSLAALTRFYGEGDPWVEDAELSHGTLRLTREELRAFGDEYLALLGRYARAAEDAPDGARPVIALFAAFPSQPSAQ